MTASPDGAAPAKRLRELQAWQAARLAATYGDLRGDPRYRPALDFFLGDLYGPTDSRQRDRQLDRAWRLLQRALPGHLRAALDRAIELQALTAEFDLAMARALPAGPIGANSYGAAYRAVGRRSAREHQIGLIVAVGRDLDRAARQRWTAFALRAAHVPAHAAGFGALQDFLERGFAAFQAMRGAAGLLRLIEARELQVMEALLSGGDLEPLAASQWRAGTAGAAAR
ncbi:MAG: hypothetical protein JSR15_07775 [Proteobacteria bacterium]|nr:hypothetical protein [Pseudomonadota bacterium]